MDSGNTQAVIRTAIKERRLIEFSLHGLRRVAEPHVLGEHAGMIQVLVYQVAGETSSSRLKHWRRVVLADVVDLRLLTETFPGSRTDRYVDWDRIELSVGEPPTAASGT